ncbi:unnamed protein product [Fraxinus pennsylvanica]|uniref:Pentatricopeptide repeat-containing protein n=1 Tax=Fraxinus pennsylvanica TaxID=56036 RepID=A0AAD1ZW15_9LAMI|nr:unnamed protein product [Fraxinus pennsylvanica]
MLVKAKAAKSVLEETKFEPEPRCLESNIEGLYENGLVEEALDVFKQLKMAGHCVFLKIWNSAVLQSVKAKRVGHYLENKATSFFDSFQRRGMSYVQRKQIQQLPQLQPTQKQIQQQQLNQLLP